MTGERDFEGDGKGEPAFTLFAEGVGGASSSSSFLRFRAGVLPFVGDAWSAPLPFVRPFFGTGSEGSMAVIAFTVYKVYGRQIQQWMNRQRQSKSQRRVPGLAPRRV